MEFVKITEQPSPYDGLDRMSAHDILHAINDQDRRVAEAVGRALPAIERLVERCRSACGAEDDYFI